MFRVKNQGLILGFHENHEVCYLKTLLLNMDFTHNPLGC